VGTEVLRGKKVGGHKGKVGKRTGDGQIGGKGGGRGQAETKAGCSKDGERGESGHDRVGRPGAFPTCASWVGGVNTSQNVKRNVRPHRQMRAGRSGNEMLSSGLWEEDISERGRQEGLTQKQPVG